MFRKHVSSSLPAVAVFTKSDDFFSAYIFLNRRRERRSPRLAFTVSPKVTILLRVLFFKQEAREAAAAAREKEIEERGALKARDAAKAAGLPSPEDFNNAPPTVADKALSALPYVLPLMDSLVFGSHIFQTYATQVAGIGGVVCGRRGGAGVGCDVVLCPDRRYLLRVR